MGRNEALENLSLDLETYSLDEIINLLQLPHISEITQENLKYARKQVVQLHPDKSGLDAKYFRFFVKAYEHIEHVVDFANRATTNANSSRYRERHAEIEKDLDKNENILNSMIKTNILTSDRRVGKSWDKFQEKFNRWFDKYGELSQDNDGYEAFLKDTSNLIPEGASQAEARAFMERKRSELRALVIHEDVQCLDSWQSSSMGRGIAQAEDLRRAYTETLIPVGEDELENRTKHSSIDSLQRERHSAVESIDYEEGLREEKAAKERENREDMARYSEALQQAEFRAKSVREFQQQFLRLKM